MPIFPPKALAVVAAVGVWLTSSLARADAPSPDPEPAAVPTTAPNGPGWAFGSGAAEVALGAASLASLATLAIPQHNSSWGPVAPAPFVARWDALSNFTGAYIGTAASMLAGFGLEYAYYRGQGDAEGITRALRSSLVEAEAVAMTSGLTVGIKALTGRCRPRAYENGACVGGEYDAFPSGHTSVISAVAGVRLVHALRSPGNATARYVSFGLAEAASIVTAALRVGAGAHSSSDVLAGYALGHGVGVLMALAHPWRASTPVVTVPIRELDGAAHPTELPIAPPSAPTIAGSWTFHF